MSRIDWARVEQLTHPRDTGSLNLDACLDIDELGGDVLRAGGGRGESVHACEGVHHLVEVVDRHPQDHPRPERLARLVGLGLVVGDLASVLVDQHLDVVPRLAHVVAAQRDRTGLDQRLLRHQVHGLGGVARVVGPARVGRCCLGRRSGLPVARTAGIHVRTDITTTLGGGRPEVVGPAGAGREREQQSGGRDREEASGAHGRTTDGMSTWFRGRSYRGQGVMRSFLSAR